MTMKRSLNKSLLSILLILLVIFIYSNRYRQNEDNQSGIEFINPYEVQIMWDLPWFFADGGYKSGGRGNLSQNLWPTITSDDRIVSQLMYAPDIPEGTVKKIYVSDMKYFLYTVKGTELEHDVCPVSNCIITSVIEEADAALFKNVIRLKRKLFPVKQIWIIFLMENPLYSAKKFQSNAVNWTATYRTDSDIVTPYGKWVYYNQDIKSKEQNVNYASGKSHKVAWIVSNCRASNRRMEYARELKKYIDVDIYGSCGSMSCPRSKFFSCHNMLSKHYKFYLSFENGNCIDYITEKFYNLGLGFNMIPIVMGARKEDYKKVAPSNSYIHVEDFENAESLAGYLHTIDKNDTMYNSYFKWKGTGEFVDTHFFCRLCAILNSDPPLNKTYTNFTDWWNKPGTCMKNRWDGRT